ncbi:uncharacterized protein T551_00198 [Pneumocystis jirovecii RU7]|uniref:Transcription factor Pcc1 n=1 Tax=Pneumocystis jirovecii (strain RU7) TaxID=1408657 RepID=A0A0W4ZWF5_PNEJ7|nr:uncharacterized protein T551_00198 [Pneumocystis jirovecii RU7]KTW32713.1 hypothetical protein T551_00198 [Pneumocystis jirovecii RU7]
MSRRSIELGHAIDISIPFPNEWLPSQIATVLSVDPELKEQVIYREIKVDGSYLFASFQSADLKTLRVSVDAFLDNVVLIIRTVNECGNL